MTQVFLGSVAFRLHVRSQELSGHFMDCAIVEAALFPITQSTAYIPQAFRIGHDIKSVFSNGATARQVSSVTSWLKGQGFTRGSDKNTVSLHVVDVDANASYNIAMDVMPG